MAISGSLKDVSVADVMQFIHLGRRTGTLLLQRGPEKAMIGFHGGRLVSAQAPRTPKLGDLLVSSGTLARDVLEEAVDLQSGQPAGERRSLGQILVASGAIAGQDLRNVIGEQIEQAVAEVMVWDSGTFEFAIDDLRPVDDIALYPSDVMPDADINTQMVLLEAARIFDERSRTGAPEESPWEAAEADAAEPEAPAAEAEDFVVPASAGQVELHIVSQDQPLAEQIHQTLGEKLGGVRLTSLAQAGESRYGVSPVVLLDLRNGEVSLDQAASLHRHHPGASLIALVDPGTSFSGVYGAGVLAALPAEAEAVTACVENVLRNRRDTVRAHEGGEARSGGGVARLRRVFGDLRSGLISATVALNLMHIISESVERAVLFLVKRDQLMALGAFGTDAQGRALAEVTRGIRLPIEGESILTTSLETGEVQAKAFEEAALPEPFLSLVGRPRNGQVVVFPVLGSNRVISVIYTDNGEREEPVEDIDILELATAQVGMAFENELLRRQISQKD